MIIFFTKKRTLHLQGALQRVEKPNYKFLHAGRLWESEINFVFCERELYDGTAPEQNTKSAKDGKDSMSLPSFKFLRVQQVAPTVSPVGSVGASALCAEVSTGDPHPLQGRQKG